MRTAALLLTVPALCAATSGALAQSVIDTPARLDQSVLFGGGSFNSIYNNAQFYPSFTSSFTNYYLNQNAWFYRLEGGGSTTYNGIWPIAGLSASNGFAPGPATNIGVYSFNHNGTLAGLFDARLTITVFSGGTNGFGLPVAWLQQVMEITNTGPAAFTMQLFAVQSLPVAGAYSNTTWAATDYNASSGTASRFRVTQSGGNGFNEVLAHGNGKWQLGLNSTTSSAGISHLFAPSNGSGTGGSTTVNLSNTSLVTGLTSQGPQSLGGSVAVQWGLTIAPGQTATVSIDTGFNAAPDTAPCFADYDRNGFVNGDDFDSFVVDFELGLPGADVNRDTFVSGDDFDFFIVRFEAGC